LKLARLGYALPAGLVLPLQSCLFLQRTFETPFNVCLTTLIIEKLLPENQGSGACDRDLELHLRLKLTLFKRPLSNGLGGTNRRINEPSVMLWKNHLLRSLNELQVLA
jgi:hypothetical protein